MIRAIESAVRVHQDNDVSVDASLAFAAVLRRLIVSGGSVMDAALWAETSRHSTVSSVQRALITEVRMAGKGGVVRLSREQIGIWGLSCGLPRCVEGHPVRRDACHVLPRGGLVQYMGGGDVCSRNIGIGALWGAATAVADGMEEEEEEEEEKGRGIPMEWREKTHVLEEVEELVEKMLG